MKTKMNTPIGEPIHRVIEEPLRPVKVAEVHLYQGAKYDSKTGRKVRGVSQYDVMFLYVGRTEQHWVNDACKEFAEVVTSWMLAGQAAAVGDVTYHAAWDRGWTWRIM